MEWSGRARRLVGVRFRPQGRDPSTGLDCIGLALAAYGLPSNAVRDDYRMRGNHLVELKAAILSSFRRVPRPTARNGDMMLFQVAADQYHLGIKTDRGIVHADAGLRKVVERPGVAPWPVVAAYRMRCRAKRVG